MTDDSVTFPQPTDPQPDERFLEKYLAGECTFPERVAMERWILVHPECMEAMVALSVDGQVGRETLADSQAIHALEHRVLDRIGGLKDSPIDPQFPRTPFPNHKTRAFSTSDFKVRWQALVQSRRVVHTVLATCGLLVMASVLLLTQEKDSSRRPMDLFSTYTTEHGQRSSITLPDGTKVVLNVGSRLDVPVDYHVNNRVLRLKGEALFTVVPQPGTPLTVQAGHTLTHVLGTRFVVRHYDDDPATVVAVEEGKVSVQGTVLTAAQRIVIDAKGRGTVHVADPGQFAFAQGKLILQEVPLLSAIPELNRWYDTDIRLGDARLVDQEITGGFSEGSLTDLVTILEVTLNVRVVRTGKMLTLYPKS